MPLMSNISQIDPLEGQRSVGDRAVEHLAYRHGGPGQERAQRHVVGTCGEDFAQCPLAPAKRAARDDAARE
jgi:hypothetical protein